MRRVLVGYGILNGILYLSLLPLWDGFDEPFHYAYVQALSHGCGFPVLGKTTIMEEIWRSLAIAPGSYAVKENLPVVMTFGEWFVLEAADRARLRGQLESLRPATGCSNVGPLNYEAQQAPLAYALLAAPDYLWRQQPLLERVWRLRMLCAIASSVATALAAFRLARQLKLREEFAASAVFLALSWQMFYATTAHLANDWLAIPLAVLLVSVAIGAWEKPGRASAAALALTLGAGLLTKAYFLSFVPLAVGLVAWLLWKRRLRWDGAAWFAVLLAATAGPWYARNVALYGSLSAMQETLQHGSLGELASAATRAPWLRSLLDTARASLWTGNNSFTAFSATTIGLMLTAIAAAAVLYAAGARRNPPAAAEWLVIAAAGCYAAGLAYSAMVNFWHSKGAMIVASPWYVQPLVPIVLCLLFLGLARGRLAGRIVAIASVCLWAYVISATYVAKLIPFYSGYAGRAQVTRILRWYLGSFAAVREALENTAMRGPAVLFGLTAVLVVCAVTLAAVLALRLGRSKVG
jgi:4-amino-4-deoxy-L-arabinose transferase-like glycosyltransferase